MRDFYSVSQKILYRIFSFIRFTTTAKPIVLTCIVFFFLCAATNAFSRSWSDLDEDESKDVFGSEREAKYPINAFIVEREKWENHSSLMLFWIIKSTDYPKYDSFRFLPFWYSKDSKIDNRALRLIPLTLTYWSRDGDDRFRAWYLPPFIVSYENVKNDEHVNGSLFHFYYSDKIYNDATQRLWWVPIIPLVLRWDEPGDGGYQSIFWLLQYKWSSAQIPNTDQFAETMDFFWLIPLFFHGWGADGYTAVIPPIYIDNRHSNGERYNHLLPLWIYDKTIDQYSEYDPTGKIKSSRIENTRMLWTPLFYSQKVRKDNWTNDPVRERFFFPTIPFLYYSYNEQETGTHRNTAVLFDWHTSPEGKIDRFFTMPFVFWKSERYLHVLPFFMRFLHCDDGGSYMHLLPLFIHSTSIGSTDVEILSIDKKVKSTWEKRPQYSASTFTLLSGRMTTRDTSFNGEIQSSITFFPIIPFLFYHSYDKDQGSHTNAAMLFDWRTNADGSAERFWSPLFFWRADEYMNILPPIYMHFKDVGGSYTHLLPFFIHTKDIAVNDKPKSTQSKTYSSSTYTLFSGRSTSRSDSFDGEIQSSNIFFPIVPFLFYHSYDKNAGTHTNVAMLFDWRTNANGSAKRIWSPFFLWGKDSYTLVLPPIFMHFENEGNSYTHLLPIFVQSKDIVPDYKPGREPNRLFSTATYSVLSGRETLRKNSYDGEIHSSRTFFPIIPILFYHSYNEEEGSHTNIAMLIDWKKDQYGGLNRLFIAPFYFENYSDGGYRVIPPFYIRPSGSSEERGLSFGLLHYHSWEPGKETTIFPLHFRRDNESTARHVNLWFPLYWNYESNSREWSLVLPLWFNTINKNNGNKFHLNIIGISRSVLSGPNPIADGSFGFNERGLYIDGRLSWLYNMASFETRITIPIKKTDPVFANETPAAPETTDSNKVSLSDVALVSRDKSINYTGWSFLYGLIAYKSSETKTQFRILPLTWLTWSKESDNALLAGPLFLYYKDPEISYLVVPFYASQHAGESYKIGYGFTVFWDEYDALTQKNEHTVLWPFINWYSSPKENGWRMFPIVWHRSWDDDETRYSRYVTPLSYKKTGYSIATGEESRTISFSPIHYHRYSKNTSEEKSTIFSLLPLPFYRSYNEPLAQIQQTKDIIRQNGSSTFWLFPIVYHGRDTQSFTNSPDNTSSSSTLTPFSSWSSSQTTGRSSSTNDSFRMIYPIIPIPLFLSQHHTETDSNGEEKTEGYTFALGYYTADWSTYSRLNFLWKAGYDSITYPNGEYSTTILFGLYKSTKINGESSSRLFPLFHFGNGSEGNSTSFLLGLWRFTKGPEQDDLSWRLLFITGYRSKTNDTIRDYRDIATNGASSSSYFFPLYSYYSATDSSGLLSIRSIWSIPFHYYNNSQVGNSVYKTFWAPILPLIYYHTESDRSHLNILGVFDYSSTLASSQLVLFPFFSNYSATGSSGSSGEHSIWSIPFHYYHDSSEGHADYKTIWAPILPLAFYYHSETDYTHVNVFGLIDHASTPSNSRTWVLPLYYASTATNGSKGFRYATPLYLSWWDSAHNSTSRLVIGTYFHSSPEYSRQNFLFLFDHSRHTYENKNSYRFIFNAFNYTKSDSYHSLKLLWGGAADFRIFRKTDDYEASALLYLASLQRHGDEFHSRILPLYYYTSDSSESSLYIPPLLSYRGTESNGNEFTLGALGLAFYDNDKPAQRYETEHLLLGIPWYSIQRPERGYHAIGSLWSLLWQYETEDETGFSKFTFLKFVYKRVVLNGETRHSILGVSF